MQRPVSLKRMPQFEQQMETAREKGKLSSLQRLITRECSAEEGFKQGKRVNEIDGLYVQNLAMVLLNFKNYFFRKTIKTRNNQDRNKQQTCYKCKQNLTAFLSQYSEDLQKDKRMKNFIHLFFTKQALFKTLESLCHIMLSSSCLSPYYHFLSHICICKI